MDVLEKARQTGCADAQSGLDGRAEVHRFPVLQEAVRACGGRCRLAPVVGAELTSLVVPVEEKGAAAQAGGLRFDQPEDELGGDGRVHS